MGHLLSISPMPREAPAEQPIQQRIRVRSRILAGLFTGLLWLVAGLNVAMVLCALFYRGSDFLHVLIGPEGVDIIPGRAPVVVPPGFQDLADLALRYRLGGAFALIVQFGPSVLVLRNLRDLFRLYAGGTVFAEANARCIKRIGLWLIALATAPLLSVQLLILLDAAIDRAWFHLVELQALVLGVILFVVAQVMEAGRAIEQDRDGFI